MIDIMMMMSICQTAPYNHITNLIYMSYERLLRFPECLFGTIYDDK